MKKVGCLTFFTLLGLMLFLFMRLSISVCCRWFFKAYRDLCAMVQLETREREKYRHPLFQAQRVRDD